MGSKYEKLEGVYSVELIQLVRQCLILDPLSRPQSLFQLQKTLQEPIAGTKDNIFLQMEKAVF